MEVRGMFISLINKGGFLLFCQLMANIPFVVVFVLEVVPRQLRVGSFLTMCTVKYY
jgi:hypothetical protein